ncbi:MAG: HAMP domain-containing protein [Actinobacteria bacterium]|nr:HAMP domain-containing protein [Actinomycetota bacterium]
MALVLAAVAIFLYVRLGSTLAEQIDDTLESRSAVIARNGYRFETGAEDGFAQLLGPGGAIAVGSRVREPLLDTSELSRARKGPVHVSRDSLPELEGEPVRLYATPARDGVLVVGASLEEREEALAGLLRELLIVLPLALVAAAAGGYLLAAAALRPVELMRRRAAEITSADPSRRLPLSDANDEITRLGVTLNEMLARLEEGLERERRFVADASHELRTPLALLRTELELALRRPRTRDELETALRSATVETERVSRLAEDLLVLATAERGRLPLRLEELATEELLATVVARFASRAATEGRSVTSIASNAPRLVGDRLRLEQALGNLVDNALTHASGRVRLVAEHGGGFVELHVSDEGDGFPPSFTSSAFDPFTRADGARAVAGAGLGLAIVDAVARAHGGTARIELAANGGAVVILSLPAAPAEHVSD